MLAQMTITRLTSRRDFVRMRDAEKFVTPAFILQVESREDDSDDMRVGFTVTKKIGNAVIRNRVKRRLREVVKHILDDKGTNGCNYVFIARKAAITRSFEAMCKDLERVL